MVKLTPQREIFAQIVVKGNNQSDAYRKAFPKSLKWKDNAVNVNASKLMADANVILRVNELRAPVVAKIQYGLEQAMNEAHEALEVCRNKEQGGAMVQAVTLKAKLNNLLVERKEIRIGALDNLEHDDTQAIADAIQRRMGGSTGEPVITIGSSGTRH